MIDIGYQDLWDELPVLETREKERHHPPSLKKLRLRARYVPPSTEPHLKCDVCGWMYKQSASFVYPDRTIKGERFLCNWCKREERDERNRSRS
jgi:hypothetical protein